MNGFEGRPLFRLFMRRTATGYLVVGPGSSSGPFPRPTALNLAEGMIEAVRSTGQAAELVIEG